MNDLNNASTSNDEGDVMTNPGDASHSPGSWEYSVNIPDDVQFFLSRFFPNGLVHYRSSFLFYEGGYWKRLDERSGLAPLVARYFAADAKRNKITALIAMLKYVCVVTDGDFKSNPNHICFVNGVLDLETFTLLPHSSKHHLRSGRPVSWDENAQSPAFDQFLESIFRDDADKDEKKQFITEWMGLCLIPDTSYEKFVMMVGEGSNGKSVLLKLMYELLGAENVYSSPIQRLGNRRALAELEGKLLLTSSEINKNSRMEDGILKQLVSGDCVEAERKYEHPFSFIPTVRLMLATNHLPELHDVTHAFFRRLILIKFNRVIEGDEVDIHLLSKLKAEMQGIFAAAVSGLRALRARGHFIIPQGSVQAAKQYRYESSTSELFVEHALLRCENREKGMTPRDVFNLYLKWCSAYKEFADLNHITFGKFLAGQGFKKVRSGGREYWSVKLTDTGREILTKPSAKEIDLSHDEVTSIKDDVVREQQTSAVYRLRKAA